MDLDFSDVPSDVALFLTTTDEWVDEGVFSLTSALGLDSVHGELLRQELIGAVASVVDDYLPTSAW